MMCGALHNGCRLESSGGAAVARAVQVSRSRRERIVVTSIATTLSPIERAVVLLRGARCSTCPRSQRSAPDLDRRPGADVDAIAGIQQHRLIRFYR